MGQASDSPARQVLGSASTPPLPGAPMSPSSSNASMRKKLVSVLERTSIFLEDFRFLFFP